MNETTQACFLPFRKVAESAEEKWGDGTTYRANGETKTRISAPGTPKGNAYCARSAKQKQTPKVKQRRKDWGCRGTKSVKKSGSEKTKSKENKSKETKDNKKSEGRCWKGYMPVKGKKPYSEGSCIKKESTQSAFLPFHKFVQNFQ